MKTLQNTLQHTILESSYNSIPVKELERILSEILDELKTVDPTDTVLVWTVKGRKEEATPFFGTYFEKSESEYKTNGKRIHEMYIM